MDDMITLLGEIRDLLVEMNGKLDDIKGYGADTSISNVCDKLDAISGSGLSNLDEVCNKIDELKDEVSSVKGSGLYDTISDVCDKLDTLDSTIDLK